MADTDSNSDRSFACTTARKFERNHVGVMEFVPERMFARWPQGIWLWAPPEGIDDTRTVEEREWAALFVGAEEHKARVSRQCCTNLGVNIGSKVE